MQTDQRIFDHDHVDDDPIDHDRIYDHVGATRDRYVDDHASYHVG
jgi:hypothetical protein